MQELSYLGRKPKSLPQDPFMSLHLSEARSRGDVYMHMDFL